MTRKFQRSVNLLELLKKRSHFLFGARGTGKSTLIADCFAGEDFCLINLLDDRVYQRLLQDNTYLSQMIADKKLVVIDEVQRIPDILNEVHRLVSIDSNLHFLLTGSSARKLFKNQSNLLGGRARRAELFPLTIHELGNDFDLNRVLQFGSLPMTFLSDEPLEELAAYCGEYLKEEVQRESEIRQLQSFSRFLKSAALCNGQQINYAQFASDAGVSGPTAKEYFQILKDTLIAFEVEPAHSLKSRKQVATAKFYFFDCGVSYYLAGFSTLEPESKGFGDQFEQLIALELRAYISYTRKLNLSLNYWRTKSGSEIDFILGETFAIEVKSSERLNSRHFKTISTLLKIEPKIRKAIVVSRDTITKLSPSGEVENYYYRDFFEVLWKGGFDKYF
jgi:predicted AAA+ superfamily ATPase